MFVNVIMSIKLTDENWDEIVGDARLPVVVDFWAEWCGPCINVIGPLIDQVSVEFEGKVIAGKINVDENPQIATRYGVRNLPTVLFFNKGIVSDKLVGAVSKSQMVKKIESQIQNQ